MSASEVCRVTDGDSLLVSVLVNRTTVFPLPGVFERGTLFVTTGHAVRAIVPRRAVTISDQLPVPEPPPPPPANQPLVLTDSESDSDDYRYG